MRPFGVEFAEPWFLVAVLLAAPAYWWASRGAGRMVFSSLRALPADGGTWRTRCAWVPDVLLALAVAALAVALAGPRRGDRTSRVRRNGIAIVMALDVSGSMRALDLSEKTRELTRLDAVKQVFERFVLGGEGLNGRADDAVGLVAFARYADTRSPLTLDHDNLAAAARELDFALRDEDGTAIGAGLELAVTRLSEFRKSDRGVSRVAILLTDGESNVHDIDEDTAIEDAVKHGVKVYAIGAGTTGIAPIRVPRGDGSSELMQTRVSIDETTLRKIADRTGGRYFRATDNESLAKVYAEIDALERTTIEQEQFTEYRLFYAHFVAAAMALLVTAHLLRSTALQEAPVIDWSFAEIGAIHAVWIALAVALLLAFLEFRSRGALHEFLSQAMQPRLTARASAGRTALRLSLVLASMLFAVGALMRPQARGERETVTVASVSGEVVFAVDTSRSMLAEDTAPNRLARAKAEIAQMVARLEGQRVGLVAFAGRATQMCPLTPDHAFFTSVLSTVDTRVAGKGGTKIGEAIKVALRGFSTGGGARLIVLITDGDDQDAYSEEAAKIARDAGVKILAVGLGSEEGSQITLRDPETGAKSTLLDAGGQPVVSKLNAEQLRKIALVTEGAYIPAGTSAIDLDSIMESYVQPVVRAAADAAIRRIPAERYPAFVLASLVTLLASLWVGAGAGDRRMA